MGDRVKVVIDGPRDRAQVARWAQTCALGTVFYIKKDLRSDKANKCMWAKLTHFAEQVAFIVNKGFVVVPPDVEGVRFPPEYWKRYFTHTLAIGEWMPHENGGMIPIDLDRTSEMSSEESSDLIALMEATAARWGVDLSVRERAA